MCTIALHISSARVERRMVTACDLHITFMSLLTGLVRCLSLTHICIPSEIDIHARGRLVECTQTHILNACILQVRNWYSPGPAVVVIGGQNSHPWRREPGMESARALFQMLDAHEFLMLFPNGGTLWGGGLGTSTLAFTSVCPVLHSRSIHLVILTLHYVPACISPQVAGASGLATTARRSKPWACRARRPTRGLRTHSWRTCRPPGSRLCCAASFAP